MEDPLANLQGHTMATVSGGSRKPLSPRGRGVGGEGEKQTAKGATPHPESGPLTPDPSPPRGEGRNWPATLMRGPMNLRTVSALLLWPVLASAALAAPESWADKRLPAVEGLVLWLDANS